MIESEDLLVTRIVDRTAAHEDWVAFENLARIDAGAWERLHASLQDDLLLRTALQPAFDLADSIELQRLPVAPPLPRFLAPAGWLAALVLALLWIGTSGLFSRTKPVDDPDANFIDSGFADGQFVTNRESSLLAQKDPRVVLEELPPDVLEWQPREDGSVELVWLRQTVERAVVNTVYRMAEDELGNPRPAQLINTRKLAPPLVY